MKRNQIFMFFVGVLFFASCTKAVIDNEEPTGPITETVTYNAVVSDIMVNNCVTCHSGLAPSAGLDLTTYANVRFSTENGSLLGRIENVGNPMPPNGLMPSNLRAQIAKWAQDGYPEN